MVDATIYIVKILCYYIFVFLMYQIALRNKKFECISFDKKEKFSLQNKKNRFLHRYILLLGVVIGQYAVICGYKPYHSDRLNYAFSFENKVDVSDSSMGLYVVNKLLNIFTTNPDALFFTIGFGCFVITLLAYRIYPNAEPQTLLFMGLSNYCIYSFYLLKQAPAMALIAISIGAFFNKKKFIAIITLGVAICFHESSLIMIPVYIVLIGAKKKWMRCLEYFFLMICLFYFYPLSQIISDLAIGIFPMLKTQLEIYLDIDGGFVTEANYATIVKGAPYYIITVYGFFKRKELKEKIQNYDGYLVLSVFASFTVLMSFYMYWMWRFGVYCYFPTFIFASLLYKESKSGGAGENFGILLSMAFGILSLRYLMQIYFYYGGF